MLSFLLLQPIPILPSVYCVLVISLATCLSSLNTSIIIMFLTSISDISHAIYLGGPYGQCFAMHELLGRRGVALHKCVEFGLRGQVVCMIACLRTAALVAARRTHRHPSRVWFLLNHHKKIDSSCPQVLANMVSNIACRVRVSVNMHHCDYRLLCSFSLGLRFCIRCHRSHSRVLQLSGRSGRSRGGRRVGRLCYRHG